jgi:hypothetical protein
VILPVGLLADKPVALDKLLRPAKMGHVNHRATECEGQAPLLAGLGEGLQ